MTDTTAPTPRWRGVMEEYRSYLDVPGGADPITLLEGNTPLVPAARLGAACGVSARLYLKCEGLNPTGSFKDRGMTAAVTAARAAGASAVICASTGNTSASAAAYAARAGMRAFVVIPEGRVAAGKLAQAVVHGATIVAIDGNFDAALTIVRQLGDEEGLAIVNSVNPFRIQGQKTAAFEICDALGRAPDHHILPVGNAGNIMAYWMGYREYCEAGRVSSRPAMLGVQAAGAAPLVLGHPVARPETVATAIRIGDPASQAGALAARDESGGAIYAVTDEEILAAYRLLATTEGIFAEPASAASVAGLVKLAETGTVGAGSTVVCTLTGHGLKDPDTAIRDRPAIIRARAEYDRIREIVTA